MDATSSLSLKSKKSLDRCEGHMSSQHWNRAEQLFVEDSGFLEEEELSEEFIRETVEKFSQCIKLLYNHKDNSREVGEFCAGTNGGVTNGGYNDDEENENEDDDGNEFDFEFDSEGQSGDEEFYNEDI